MNIKNIGTLNCGYNFILLMNDGKKFIEKNYEKIKIDFEKIYRGTT